MNDNTPSSLDDFYTGLLSILNNQYEKHSFWLGLLIINLFLLIIAFAFFKFTNEDKNHERTKYLKYTKGFLIALAIIFSINYYVYEPSFKNLPSNPYVNIGK
ncbi:hypothetical protein ABEH01_08345 [Pantoea agglomerans]|uniref:hypothetical protein n=1 Tax=Enterobacter agglomerans TaxID=549 RepID=UPI0032089C8D